MGVLGCDFFFLHSPWLCNQFWLTTCEPDCQANFAHPLCGLYTQPKVFTPQLSVILASRRQNTFMLFIAHQQMPDVLLSSGITAGGLLLKTAPAQISITNPPCQWLVTYTPYTPSSYNVLTHGNITYHFSLSPCMFWMQCSEKCLPDSIPTKSGSVPIVFPGNCPSFHCLWISFLPFSLTSRSWLSHASFFPFFPDFYTWGLRALAVYGKHP